MAFIWHCGEEQDNLGANDLNQEESIAIKGGFGMQAVPTEQESTAYAMEQLDKRPVLPIQLTHLRCSFLVPLTRHYCVSAIHGCRREVFMAFSFPKRSLTLRVL